MKKLIDTAGEMTRISLPRSGVVRVGQQLQDIDLGILEKELKDFYGDRFQVVEIEPPAPAPEKKPHRRRSPKEDDGLSDSLQTGHDSR